MVRPTQERYLEDKPGNNKMDTNKEGAINNEVVSVGSDFVVTNNCVREFTTNSLDMDTRRTVKTNNTMLSSTPISTSTSWTTPSPHPTTQAWSPTESTPTTRLPPSLNIMDNTEFTINSADVDTSRAVQAIINNAAINSTDWLAVRLPVHQSWQQHRR